MHSKTISARLQNLPTSTTQFILRYLKRTDHVQLLSTCETLKQQFHEQLETCQGLIRNIRIALTPLLHMRIRLPGFFTPTHTFIESTQHNYSTYPYLHEWAQHWGNPHALSTWLDDVGMGAFNPSEAILPLNAWTQRAQGTRLSDFLCSAFTQYFYVPVEHHRRRTTHDASLVICFEYHDFCGIIWTGQIARNRRVKTRECTRQS